jgi:OCT family organic cation transporter-like MFS transporter 4/5
MRGKLASAVYEVGNQVGGLLLLGSFYFVGDYFRIEMTVRIVEIVLFIGYIFTVKESPRWLITHGKWKEAERLLKSVAMEKGVHSEKEIERRIIRLRQWTMKQQSEEERKKKQSIFDIWREPKLLKTSLILYFSFFALEFISQATLLNVGQLGGSVYAIQLFGKILAFPSVALVYYVMPRVERRRLGRSCLLIMTVCLLLSLGCTLFPSFLLYPLVLFSRIYKTSGGMTMKTLYVLSTEIFPTNMRQTSVGVCSLFARFGSVIAPFVKELTIATYLWIPFAIYTILTVTTAFLWIFLPNTFDVHLPDNIKQSTRLENECEKTQNDETH